MNSLIFLIGMPAVGKTYWGEKMAKEYCLPFRDLDVFIETQESMTIAGLFAQYGEIGFREKEDEYLLQAINMNTDPAIIACGGGTPCFNDNIRVMKENGIVIYLQADVPYLLNNIINSPGIRPLLANKEDLAGRLEELLKIRKAVYEEAHYILDAKNISLATFDKIISQCINRH